MCLTKQEISVNAYKYRDDLMGSDLKKQQECNRDLGQKLQFLLIYKIPEALCLSHLFQKLDILQQAQKMGEKKLAEEKNVTLVIDLTSVYLP